MLKIDKIRLCLFFSYPVQQNLLLTESNLRLEAEKNNIQDYK